MNTLAACIMVVTLWGEGSINPIGTIAVTSYPMGSVVACEAAAKELADRNTLVACINTANGAVSKFGGTPSQ